MVNSVYLVGKLVCTYHFFSTQYNAIEVDSRCIMYASYPGFLPNSRPKAGTVMKATMAVRFALRHAAKRSSVRRVLSRAHLTDKKRISQSL